MDKRVFYLKINQCTEFSIRCFWHWYRTVEELGAEYYVVVDNEKVKTVLTNLFMSNDRSVPVFIASYRKRFADLFQGIDFKTDRNWNNIGAALYTPLFHAKDNGYKYIWNIDADDTMFLAEPKTIISFLNEAEQCGIESSIDVFSLDMYYSSMGDGYWTFGVAFVNLTNVDFDTCIKKGKDLVVSEAKRLSWGLRLDAVFQIMANHNVFRCMAFSCDGLWFRHSYQAKQTWKNKQIVYAFKNQWTNLRIDLWEKCKQEIMERGETLPPIYKNLVQLNTRIEPGDSSLQFEEKIMSEPLKYVPYILMPIPDSINALSKCETFETYIHSLFCFAEQLVIIISTCDNHTPRSLNNIKLQLLSAFGIKTDLQRKYGYSFVAVVDGGKTVVESFSENSVIATEYTVRECNARFEITSHGYNVNNKNICPIKIYLNNINYAVSKRGLNFVVFDKRAKKVIDSVAFDTFSYNSPVRNKMMPLPNSQKIENGVNITSDLYMRLFSCFNTGYTIPQFCMDNDFRRPMIVSGSSELLYIIYEQFFYSKQVEARYLVLGETKLLKDFSSLNILPLQVDVFSADKCSNADVILYFSENPLTFRSPIQLLGLRNIVDMMFRYTFCERPIYNFLRFHPNVKVITYSHPDLIENEYNSELEKKVLTENFKRTLIANNRNGVSEHTWTPLDEFGYSNAEVLKLLDMPTAKTDWKGCTHFEDSNNDLFNSRGGNRQTAYQPKEYKHVIYMLGTCVCVGYAAPWDKTMPSYLQGILNDNNEGYLVENISQFYNGRYQDIFYNLNALPVKEGDIIFICLQHATLRDIPSFFGKHLFKRPHNYGELYIDKYHVNERGYKIIAEKLYEFLKESNFFDDYDYHTDIISREISRPHMFGIPEWADGGNNNSGQPEELKQYKEMLLQYKTDANGEIGAIVMNCNPFTLGHRYLVETAAEIVSHLYIFVVEEDKSVFPFADRMELVRKGTAHLKNVTVLPSGKFIISSLTFSDYFNKSSLQDTVIDTSMDVELFAEEIAPVLNIKVRFAGEEPLDKVTNQYNETMNKILPQHGIRFVEIPRKMFGDGVISASRVRKLLDENDFEEIRNLVPDSTYQYLVARNNDNAANKVKMLSEITDLGEYIEALTQIPKVSIFIVSKDAHTNPRNSNEQILKSLEKLGITEDLSKQYRWSFIAHIENGIVKKSTVSQTGRLTYICEFGENRAMLISEGYNVKISAICDGKIIINKRQVAVDKRGLNIVVWDNKGNKLLDSVCFDTFLDARASRTHVSPPPKR